MLVDIVKGQVGSNIGSCGKKLRYIPAGLLNLEQWAGFWISLAEQQKIECIPDRKHNKIRLGIS